MSCPFSINAGALKSEVRQALINDKANACPMAIRLAWHASGTFKADDGTGGSNGATMRHEPEASDGANAGLSIISDMLLRVKKDHPDLSHADLWTLAGAQAVEFTGGPTVPVKFGRVDAKDASTTPANGRLPDAAQGAEHLREVFGRMGFDDREIVVLSGAHTLGRAHLSRSGFDGPWTRNPLVFDNSYYTNLLDLKWKVSDRAPGVVQYEDEETGELMMLPTDIALINDPSFRAHVERFAKDEKAFFDEFATTFAKLLELGTPDAPAAPAPNADNAEFREQSMHGSLAKVSALAKKGIDANEVEASSGRSALHKAAFWGHTHLMPLLVEECKVDPNLRDSKGDTAMHDAARFGHAGVAEYLAGHGADKSIKNNEGQTAADVATEYGKDAVVAALK